MMFRIVFWDVLPLMMEAVRTSETSVDNYFTQQYIPEDNSEKLQVLQIQVTLCVGCRWCNFKHIMMNCVYNIILKVE
jgi:hypothetical protein